MTYHNHLELVSSLIEQAHIFKTKSKSDVLSSHLAKNIPIESQQVCHLFSLVFYYDLKLGDLRELEKKNLISSYRRWIH